MLEPGLSDIASSRTTLVLLYIYTRACWNRIKFKIGATYKLRHDLQKGEPKDGQPA